ncbi:MAG: DEAD/DEAH box helicase [Actinomycetes bacterium]
MEATAGALDDAGITEPFPIQEMTLPIALAGGDLIGQAKTGTGKTLAFGVPLLQRIAAPADDEPGDGRPQALVVVPTRELCVQVTGDIETAGARRKVRVLSVYGGRAYEPQIEALSSGVEVVVGTPGRLLDLARQRHLDLGHVKVLVLDEADEMLDMGFLPDVEKIIDQTPAVRQTMLFSATMPSQIVSLSRRYLRQPTNIRAHDPDDAGATVAATTQHAFRAHALDKLEMLARILQAADRGRTIVFCRTKRTAARVAEDLSERGFAAGSVHGDLGQGQREQALRAFRSAKIDVLVATDVAARGIDVLDVTHVVNYQCPEDEKIYVHRIGRTGRAGKTGIAVTLVDWDDVPRWNMISEALGLPFRDPLETYSTSEHLREALDIPASAKGTLPRSARTRAGLAAEEVEDLGGRPAPVTRSRRPAKAAESPRPSRSRNRSRRRTRNGEPVDGNGERHDGRTGAASTPPAGAASATGPAEASTGRGSTSTSTRTDERPARRRRRGRGRGRGAGGESSSGGQDAGQG